MDDLEKEMRKIQDEVHAETLTHEGQNAEEAYASRLSQLSLTEGEVPDGRTVVKALLARCTLWLEIMRQKYIFTPPSNSCAVANSRGRQGKIDERFQDLYEKLLKIRNQLEQMNLTQAWSLRETDLYSFQRQLDRVDESRVDGNFLDTVGRPADLHAQRTLLYLLRRGYAFIFQYIIQSEPVSEALLPIYNQLLTLKRCLLEVQRSGGVDSPRELYPYSMKLNSIDNMKKDGKFMVGGDIPEGQASVTTLLSECFELAYELRTEAEERKEASEQPAADQVNGVGNRTAAV